MTTSPESTGLTNGEASQPTEGSESSVPQTAEEVEAIWRNRFSQRDKAHNAEVQSLREQLTALRDSPPPSQPSGEGSESADAGYKARWEQTRRELEQERQARAIDQRRLKFPALAGEVAVDDPVWVAAKDETLARLNANLTQPPAPQPTGPIDRNNPRRDPGAGPKPVTEMTKDELLRELQRLSPAEEARMRGF